MLNRRKARLIGGAVVSGAVALTSTTVVVAPVFAVTKGEAQQTIEALFLTQEQKTAAMNQLEETQDEQVYDSIVARVQTLSNKRIEGYQKIDNLKESADYKFASDTSDIDAAIADLIQAMDETDADPAKVDFLIDYVSDKETNLDGDDVADNKVEELKATETLTQDQQDLLADAAAQQADTAALNSWAAEIEALAAKQKELLTLKAEGDDVKASADYTNATQDKQQAYDDALEAADAVTMTSLTADPNLETAVENLRAAQADLTAKSAKETAKEEIAKLNLTTEQKNKANEAVDAAADDTEIDAAVENAKALEAAIKEANEPANAATGEEENNYKFADADKKTALKDAADALKEAVAADDATADSVKTAAAAVKTADEALNGDAVLEGVVTEVKDYEGLSDTQKDLVEDEAAKQDDQDALQTWAADVKTLAEKQAELALLKADADEFKQTDAYKAADQDKKDAYDNAVATDVAEDSLSPAANLDDTIAAIKAAGEAIDSNFAKREAVATVTKLNLTPGQKTAANNAIVQADKDDVDGLVDAAKALSEERTTVETESAKLSATDSNKYKYADGDKKKTFDEKSAELITKNNEDAATAATVKTALEAAKTADADLNGEANLSQVVTGLNKLSNLSVAQKNAIETEAVKSAHLTELASFAKTVEDIDSKQKELSGLVAKAAEVKASENYKNADEATKKAYDDAITKAETLLGDNAEGLDADTLSELTQAADDVTAAEKNLTPASDEDSDNGTATVDYSKLQTAVDKYENEKYTESEDYKNGADENKAAYDKAMSDAKAILESKTATQEEVDAALKALEDAVTALTPAVLEEIEGESNLRMALIIAGVGVGALALILSSSTLSSTLVPAAPAPAPEPEPAAAAPEEAPAEVAPVEAAPVPAEAAPAEAAPATPTGRLAVTGSSASPWIASLVAMVMGIALFLGFRRRES